MAIYHNKTSEDIVVEGHSNVLKDLLRVTKDDALPLSKPSTQSVFAFEIRKRLFASLLKSAEDLKPESSFSDLDIYSLAAIEIRAWLRQTLGGILVS
jgi:hypothetical protein